MDLSKAVKDGFDRYKTAVKRANKSETFSSLAAVSDIEKLAQKRGKNTAEEKFKVLPDYAYPNTRLNRAELRKEVNKPSAYFHDLQQQQQQQQQQSSAHIRPPNPPPAGRLAVEILQCFGLPKPDLLGDASAYCIAVCGPYAFKTDVMPPVANPMWLSRMRRAAIFPIRHAYARLYVGVFGQYDKNKKDGFAGRVVLDIARLRPACSYDVTLPLRESAHVYSRHQRGAIRIRFHLHWDSERQAMLSYFPDKMPKIEPNESVTVQCCDTKSFQNVARVVHGNHMPGKFNTMQMQATLREINFTRIHILRYLRKREVYNTIHWTNPVISGFVFFAWMHCVWMASVTYVPGHVVTFLLLHLWKNYATYALDSPVQNGFLAPTWEEMLAAVIMGTKENNASCIAPLDMERKDESKVRSAMQDMTLSSSSLRGEEQEQPQTASLREIAEAFRSGVEVKDLRYRLRTYHNAFRGADAVDFLVESGYARTRERAVQIGRQLANHMKLFEHVERKHDFKDEMLFYCFLANDINEYAITTHRPWGKGLFQMLGFLPEKPLSEKEAHLEMPYADGVEYPRFTVKECLVIRSKESQRLLSQEQEDSQTDLLDSSSQTDQLAKIDEFLDENDNHELSLRVDDNLVESNNDDLIEVTYLRKAPNQDMDVKKKAEKKIADVLVEARHKAHGTLLHAFNDRVYKIDRVISSSPPGTPTRHGLLRRGGGVLSTRHIRRQKSRLSDPVLSHKPEEYVVAKKTSVDIKATEDEYNRLLSLNKYSHGNPVMSKVGVIVQPIVEICLGWLCLFRALFNMFTWRDPILSFWVSVIGPVVVVILHVFPWRIVLGIAGILLVGPQNWVLRVRRESRPDYEPYDPDKKIKKKSKKEIKSGEEEEEPPLFSMHTPNNNPVHLTSDDFDPHDVRKIVVPYSPFMYQRFYDWPPEIEYALVSKHDPPTNTDFDTLSIANSVHSSVDSVELLSISSGKRRAGSRRLIKAISRIGLHKKS